MPGPIWALVSAAIGPTALVVSAVNLFRSFQTDRRTRELALRVD
jgi:hypothetical protein